MCRNAHNLTSAVSRRLCAIALVFLFCACSQAAQVRNYFIRADTGLVDTNYLIITQISSNILASGGVTTIGVPIRAPRSPYTNYLAQGFYSVSNAVLRRAYVINVWDNSSTLYDYTNFLHSGYNTYAVTLPDLGDVIDAIGYQPQPASVNLSNWATLSTNVISTGGGGGGTFNPNQFSSGASGTNIKVGAIITNVTLNGGQILSSTDLNDDISLNISNNPALYINSTSDPFTTPVQISGTGITAHAFYGNGATLTGVQPTLNPNQFSVSGGQTNIKSGALITNAYLPGITTFTSPGGGEDVQVTLLADPAGPVLNINSTSDPFGVPVLIASTGVVASAFHGSGAGLTGILPAGISSASGVDGQVLKKVAGVWTVGDDSTGTAATSNPFTTNSTSPINVQLFSLTNFGALYQTGANGGNLLQQVVKRPVPASSHGYDALRFHYGGTNDVYWTWFVGSLTNVEAAEPYSFDHLMVYGVNIPNSTTYKPAEATLNYGFENHYVTGSGIYQMEHFMNFWQAETNKHARPWGWSYFIPPTGKPTVYHAWNVESFDFNASNGFPAINLAMSGTNAAIQTFARDSQLSFSANTRSDGGLILDPAGRLLAGIYQFGMPTFGTVIGAASNSVLLAPNASLGSQNVQLLFGATNAYTGIRWNYLSNRLEYAKNAGGVSLANLQWRAFNDFSANQGSYNVSATVGATAGDFATLGFWTNSTLNGIGFIEVTAVSANNHDSVQTWRVPIAYADQQAAPTTWFEVTADRRASRFSTNDVKIALDVSGSSAANAMNFRLRRREDSSSVAYNVTLTAYASATDDISTRFYRITSTGSGATVSGTYRHSGLAQVNGRVGIGTNNPSSTLFVSGDVTYLNGTNANIKSGIYYGDANGKQISATAAHLIASVSGTPTGTKFLRDDWTWQEATGSSIPGGADTQIQFNDGNVFNGDTGLTYSKTTDALTVGGTVTANSATINAGATIHGTLYTTNILATQDSLYLGGETGGDAVVFTTPVTGSGATFSGTVAATTLSGAGGGVTLDASGFNGNLTTSDNTLQEVAQKVDDLVAGATPGGSDTQVQYNNAGGLGGDAGFTYNAATDSATIVGTVNAATGNFGTQVGAPIVAGTYVNGVDIQGSDRVYTEFGNASAGFNKAGFAWASPAGSSNFVAGHSSLTFGFTNSTTSDRSALVGGSTNFITNADNGAIVGGQSNRLLNVNFAGIFGGSSNLVYVEGGDPLVGSNSVVIGGFGNVAGGANSFAAGKLARAIFSGGFVWQSGDATSVFDSTAQNQFLVKASGGVGINTNAPGTAALSVHGKVAASSFETASLDATNNNRLSKLISPTDATTFNFLGATITAAAGTPGTVYTYNYITHDGLGVLNLDWQPDGLGGATNRQLYADWDVQGGLRGNTNYAAYGVGTDYTVTTTPALVDFGTTDPTITIAQPGTYVIRGAAVIAFNAATYGGAQTITFKFRRTNNTAADLSATAATATVQLPLLTSYTGGQTITLPDFEYTATRGDIIQLFVSYSADPSAGTVTVTDPGTWLRAQRIH